MYSEKSNSNINGDSTHSGLRPVTCKLHSITQVVSYPHFMVTFNSCDTWQTINSVCYQFLVSNVWRVSHPGGVIG